MFSNRSTNNLRSVFITLNRKRFASPIVRELGRFEELSLVLLFLFFLLFFLSRLASFSFITLRFSSRAIDLRLSKQSHYLVSIYYLGQMWTFIWINLKWNN